MRTIVFFCLLVASSAVAQDNTFPPTGPVGIGTSGGQVNSLHLHYNGNSLTTQEPILRLSEGSNPSAAPFGILGLMFQHDSTYTSLENNFDLVLHQRDAGDLILTNWGGV